MARALPEKYRPAERILAGHEIRTPHDLVWKRIWKRIDLYNSYKFVFEDGAEFYAERGFRLESRYQPEA